jgi:hypothetical protein
MEAYSFRLRASDILNRAPVISYSFERHASTHFGVVLPTTDAQRLRDELPDQI